MQDGLCMLSCKASSFLEYQSIHVPLLRLVAKPQGRGLSWLAHTALLQLLSRVSTGQRGAAGCKTPKKLASAHSDYLANAPPGQQTEPQKRRQHHSQQQSAPNCCLKTARQTDRQTAQRTALSQTGILRSNRSARYVPVCPHPSLPLRLNKQSHPTLHPQQQPSPHPPPHTTHTHTLQAAQLTPPSAS